MRNHPTEWLHRSLQHSAAMVTVLTVFILAGRATSSCETWQEVMMCARSPGSGTMFATHWPPYHEALSLCRDRLISYNLKLLTADVVQHNPQRAWILAVFFVLQLAKSSAQKYSRLKYTPSQRCHPDDTGSQQHKWALTHWGNIPTRRERCFTWHIDATCRENSVDTLLCITFRKYPKQIIHAALLIIQLDHLKIEKKNALTRFPSIEQSSYCKPHQGTVGTMLLSKKAKSPKNTDGTTKWVQLTPSCHLVTMSSRAPTSHPDPLDLYSGTWRSVLAASAAWQLLFLWQN